MIVSAVACRPTTDSEDSTDTIYEVELTELQTTLLDQIFDESNDKLRDKKDSSVFVIQSYEDLWSLCPDGVECPDIDMKQNCIVYSPIKTSSISDELVKAELFNTQGNRGYTFVVSIRECQNCWEAIGHLYPYGVYSIPLSGQPIKLQTITLCNENTDATSNISGVVVGTISCLDINKDTRKGYYIITDTKDSILTFSDNIQIPTNYNAMGIYGVSSYQIPFRFSFVYLEPSDTDYVDYEIPASNAMLPGLPYLVEHFKQARIIQN